MRDRRRSLPTDAKYPAEVTRDDALAVKRPMIKTVMKAKLEAPLGLGERKIVIEHVRTTRESMFQNDPDSKKSFVICPILLPDWQSLGPFWSNGSKLLRSSAATICACWRII
jgi:hypothetical protein